jgi:23S rRNA pseudouridine1911/1915/1917 synthase
MNKQPLSDRILYEDNHLIAVNKLPSEIVQGDKTGDVPLSEDVKQYIKQKYYKPGNVYLGVIHRIDRPASGVVVFARTGKALTRMNELVKERRIEKKYWAIVKNQPENDEGELRNFLLKNEKKNKSFVVDSKKEGAKEAILTYCLINESRDYKLLEINLLTGRHHQIRAQLLAIGCPIKGDLKYGFDRSNKDASISLHARSVSFIHPVSKQQINILAEPPNDTLWNYFSENMV